MKHIHMMNGSVEMHFTCGLSAAPMCADGLSPLCMCIERFGLFPVWVEHHFYIHLKPDCEFWACFGLSECVCVSA